MAKSNGASIIDCFATLEDPRIERSKRHKLLGHHNHRHLRYHLRRRFMGAYRNTLSQRWVSFVGPLSRPFGKGDRRRFTAIPSGLILPQSPGYGR